MFLWVGHFARNCTPNSKGDHHIHCQSPKETRTPSLLVTVVTLTANHPSCLFFLLNKIKFIDVAEYYSITVLNRHL